jgi:predicted enzyme related to lactoylglutathione lyase
LGTSPVVLVRDLDRAIRFYRFTLGLSLAAEQEDWAMFAENVGLMLAEEPLPEDAVNLNSIVLTLLVEDVRAAYGELIEKGVPFLVAPTEVGTAMVASFRDTEGNLLQLMNPLWEGEAVTEPVEAPAEPIA